MEEGVIVQEVDGVPCRVRQEADFSWLAAYGQVRRVWDSHPSGLLWFGMEGPFGRLLVKYAGAWTVNGAYWPSQTVGLLRAETEIYRVSHPSLLPMMAHGPAGAGYAAVFPWPEWDTWAMQRGQARYLKLERQLKMLDGVYDLHARLAENGFVSVHLSDEALLLDFDGDRAVLWDADLYRRKPAFNDRGRMWGSDRFLAPEEYVRDAPLDEATVNYHMGALAFEWMGDNHDRRRETWTGPGALYAVAERACREKREERYPSVRAFLDAWREAVGRLYRY